MTSLPHLAWYPKPLGAGDTAGEGSKRALGQPDLSPQALLVRETAQNSWDARVPGSVPTFEMRMRELGPESREVLQSHVFRDYSPNLKLTASLAQRTLRAIEIVDRGTVGLGGPTRNDRLIPPGMPKDYADFVLTVGAPPETFEGGGTYGFGKMASYAASTCSTILIWSRTRDHATGTLIERFIGSAMGPTFELAGRLYTGRQWWGIEPTDDGAGSRVDPVEGPAARAFGELLFERGFAEEETGTSLLVLDPVLSDGATRTVDEWQSAVLNSLWAKIDAGQDQARQMDVHLYENGEERLLPSSEDSRIWQGLQECLREIRTTQSGGLTSNPLVRTTLLQSHRPKRALGTLALTLILDDVTDDPLSGALDAVTYMRSGAELVVRTQAFGATHVPNAHWVGVFKPLPQLDSVFAESEPPAHDNWNPAGIENPQDRSAVRVALTRVSEETQAYLRPVRADQQDSDSVSTGALSASLAGLVGSSGGGRATGTPSPPTSPRPPSPGSTPRAKIVGATVLDPSAFDLDSGRQRTLVDVQLRSPLVATVSASRLDFAVDGGALPGEDQILVDAWIHRGETLEQSSIDLHPDETATAVVSSPAGFAIDVNFAAEPKA